MSDKKIVNSGFSDWSVNQLPSLEGKTYVITGGNSGIGLEAARHLARAGAHTVLACRSEAKAKAACEAIEKSTGVAASYVLLDLGSLASVRDAADHIQKAHPRIDGLINNAGIMQTPQLTTEDGFELQVGTNHLGHFLLSGLLLPQVEAAAGRIVVVASLTHKFGKPNLDDFMLHNDYSPMKAYVQSKNFNLMFALELDRRLKAANSPARSIACHPGYTNTNIQTTGPTGILKFIYKLANPLFAQSSVVGAYPTVLSAAGTEAKAGAYYGPQQMFEYRGLVGDATVAAHTLDRAQWAQLWDMSEELVGFKWATV